MIVRWKWEKINGPEPTIPPHAQVVQDSVVFVYVNDASLYYQFLDLTLLNETIKYCCGLS